MHPTPALFGSIQSIITHPRRGAINGGSISNRSIVAPKYPVCPGPTRYTASKPPKSSRLSSLKNCTRTVWSLARNGGSEF